MYTVKEVAKKLDLTEHTVRYYTDKGLVPDLKRDQNNNRIFDEVSINWLRGAQYLKRCGMSLEDIKKYVELSLQGNSSIVERYNMIAKQKEIVLADLEVLKSMAEYITNKEKHYRNIKDQMIPDDTNPGQWQNDDLSKTCPPANNKKHTIQ